MDSETMQRILREARDKALLVQSIRETCGEAVLEATRSHVERSTREYIEGLELPSRDLYTIMEILWKSMGDLAEYSVVEMCEDRLVLNVTRCHFAEEMALLCAQEEGFALFCSYDEGFCQGLNPEIKFSRTKSIMVGQACCNHTYELGTDRE